MTKRHKKSIIAKIKGSKKQTKLRAISTVLAIAVIGGIVMLVSTKAATPSAKIEPESGTINSPAQKITDSSASGGSAVQFGANTTENQTFTLASIPDTQAEVQSTGAYPRFLNRIQWIIDNKDKVNIKYIWQVGDLQDWDDATHSHYERASAGLKKLEQAGVPYALTVGNHDTAAVCYPGSACPGINPSVAFRNIPTWDQYYPPSRFPGIHTMCSEFDTFNTRLMSAGPSGSDHNTPGYIKNQCKTKDTTANAYRTFSAGGYKWVLINFEMWPRQAVQEWMKTILERYPDHNAIFFTHTFLHDDGTISGGFGGYGSPQGTPIAVYNNVLSKYANVRFVFSGHNGSSTCGEFTGVKGNKIYAYLNNRLSSNTNHMRLMKFDVAKKTVNFQEFVPSTGGTINATSSCNTTKSFDFVK
ncbi:MAG: metallophosphoesterase [Candidatus Saccharimonadales bacterium]